MAPPADPEVQCFPSFDRVAGETRSSLNQSEKTGVFSKRAGLTNCLSLFFVFFRMTKVAHSMIYIFFFSNLIICPDIPTNMRKQCAMSSTFRQPQLLQGGSSPPVVSWESCSPAPPPPPPPPTTVLILLHLFPAERFIILSSLLSTRLQLRLAFHM